MPMLKETMLKRLLLPMVAAGGGGSATVQDTATGNPLTFLTDIARPLKSLLIPFTPQQEGTGYTSPSNVRDIVPWNGVKVYHSGEDTSNPTEYDISFPSPVYGGQHEAVSGRLADGWTVCTIKGTERTIRFSGAYRFGIYINDVISNYKKPKTVVGSADSPYIVCDKLLSRSIYRVNSGEVGVAINEQGDTFWISNGEQNLTEAQVREWLANNNLQIAYALAEPQEIQLTPQQITALVGNNTIWSDADGSLTAIYLKKG